MMRYTPTVTAAMTLLRLSVSCFLVLSGPVMAQPADWQIRGEARDPDSGDLLYTEYHETVAATADRPSSLTVSYYRPDGEHFATKALTFDLGYDYLAGLDWEDRESGTRTRGVWNPPSYRQTTTRPEESVEREVTLETPAEVVLDAAFDRYLRDHADSLSAGEPLTFPFLSLGADRVYNFRASVESRSDNTLEVRVEPASTLLRWLVDPLMLTYKTDPVRLIRFRGITNFRRNGDLVTAEIHYDYAD